MRYFLPLVLAAVASLPPQPTSQPRAQSDLMAHLDRQVIEARAERQAYFQSDYSGVEAYKASLEPYRADLAELIGVPDSCLQGTEPALLENTFVATVDGIDIYYLRLLVCDGEFEWQALAGGDGPLVMAIHGSYGTPERVMGVDPTDDYTHAFGLRLAQAGYFAVAPLVVTDPQSAADFNQGRNDLDRRAASLGYRLVGIEVGQIISAMDYFEQDRKIVYGISLGGLLAQMAGALDNSIDVTVISQYAEDREAKLVSRDYPLAYWPIDNADYIIFPGLLRKFDDRILAGLIAPRRIIFEVGNQDVRYLPALALAEQVRADYKQLGLGPEYVGLAVGDGGHETFVENVLPFLAK